METRPDTGSPGAHGLSAHETVLLLNTDVRRGLSDGVALTYLPAMNQLFHTAPVTAASWVRILALAAAAWVVVTVDKRLCPAVR